MPLDQGRAGSGAGEAWSRMGPGGLAVHRDGAAPARESQGRAGES